MLTVLLVLVAVAVLPVAIAVVIEVVQLAFLVVWLSAACAVVAISEVVKGCARLCGWRPRPHPATRAFEAREATRTDTR